MNSGTLPMVRNDSDVSTICGGICRQLGSSLDRDDNGLLSLRECLPLPQGFIGKHRGGCRDVETVCHAQHGQGDCLQ